MQSIAPAALPPVIAAHIDACTRHDPEAFMATLAAGALVNDARREFLGHPAIRAWADKEFFGDNVTLDITHAFAHAGGHIVRCLVDGDYDKTNLPSPLTLTFYFTLEAGRIAQLLIVHNKLDAA